MTKFGINSIDGRYQLKIASGNDLTVVDVDKDELAELMRKLCLYLDWEDVKGPLTEWYGDKISVLSN